MFKKTVFLIAFLVSSGLVKAAVVNDVPSKSIPFVTYKIEKSETTLTVVNQHGLQASIPTFGGELNTFIIDGIKDVNEEALSMISSYGKTLCRLIPDSDIKVSFTAGVEGKLIVGASATSGLEVTFHCDTK